MTYYDHATAMAFKLDRWSDERVPKNFELEALASAQIASAVVVKKQSLFKRFVAFYTTRTSAPKPAA